MSTSALKLDEELRGRMQTNLDRFERRAHDATDLKRAAVTLLMLAGEDNEACFVITRRTPKLSAHAGQWALPGGRVDPGETSEEAALRETREEVGATLGPESILGLMDDYPTRSGYVITPVVVWGGEIANSLRTRLKLPRSTAFRFRFSMVRMSPDCARSPKVIARSFRFLCLGPTFMHRRRR